MIEITKNGFYKFSELDLKGKKVKILDNLKVAIYDDLESKEKIKIKIGKNSNLNYFSFFSEDGIHNKHFILEKEYSKVSVKSLIFSKQNKIQSQITGELDADNTEINLDLLSFAGKNGEIELDGILKINEQLRSVKGNLDEENIFLGSTGKISGIPTLFVATNDVEASHSCKMEKISDEKLFYIRSRGVDKQSAVNIMIEAKIRSLYKDLEKYDKEFYTKLLEDIFKKIKK